MLQIGRNIERMRLVRGLSRERFAKLFEKYGLNADKLYTYEKGKASPNHLIMEKLAEYAKVSIDDLLTKDIPVADMYSSPTVTVKSNRIIESKKDEDNERLIRELKERINFLENQVQRLNDIIYKQLEKT